MKDMYVRHVLIVHVCDMNRSMWMICTHEIIYDYEYMYAHGYMNCIEMLLYMNNELTGIRFV